MFTKGVSFSHETNSVSQPNITNNITVNSSNEVNSEKPTVIVDSGEKSVQVQSVESNSENAFLKKVLSIYMNQKFYWQNKFLVLTPDELLALIQTLLPDKGIVINTNDIEDVGCCSFSNIPVKKIDGIWIEENDNKQSFKYAYSNLVSLFDEYRISIKYVRVIQ